MSGSLNLCVGMNGEHFLYAEHELKASHIRSFSPDSWPAIAQLPDTMTMLAEDPTTNSVLGPESTMANADLRVTRKRLLLPRLESGETVYDLVLGPRPIYRAAKRHPKALDLLRQLNHDELLNVAVLPLDADTNADSDGGFVTMDWGDGVKTASIGFSSSAEGSHMHSDPRLIDKLRIRWEELKLRQENDLTPGHSIPLETYLASLGYASLSAS